MQKIMVVECITCTTSSRLGMQCCRQLPWFNALYRGNKALAIKGLYPVDSVPVSELVTLAFESLPRVNEGYFLFHYVDFLKQKIGGLAWRSLQAPKDYSDFVHFFVLRKSDKKDKIEKKVIKYMLNIQSLPFAVNVMLSLCSSNNIIPD